MKTITADVRMGKSVADIVNSSAIPRWRKWALSKLMPKELYEAPPQVIAELQKGAVIGKVTMELMEVGETVDLGVVK